jgi:Dihaem cytochrome c
MNYLLRGIGVLAATGTAVVLGFSLSAGAAHGDGGENMLPRLSHKAWQQECASCHVAYPPSLLPKASWRRMMSGLDKHFGENASLDPATQADILKFLEANAANSGNKVPRRMAANEAPLRITETRWFVHEHDEVPSSVWRSPKVKSPSNCAACHSNAEQGDFNEHNVHIPK